MEYIENNYKYCQELSKLDRDQVINKIKEYSEKSGVHIIYCTDHAQELYCQIFGHKLYVHEIIKIDEKIRLHEKQINDNDEIGLILRCNLCKYQSELIARQYK